MIDEIDKIRIVSDILDSTRNNKVHSLSLVIELTEKYDCYRFTYDILWLLVDSGYLEWDAGGTEIKRSDKL